jgi:bleomycin hydrolase
MGSAASKVPAQPLNAASESLDEKGFVRSQSNTAATSPTAASQPLATDGSISLSNVNAWESAAAADPKIQLARTILAHNNIKSTLTSREAGVAIPHVFNHEVDFKVAPVTNQKSSGRCWLFATTNVIRHEVMKKLKLKEFQLSQVTVHDHRFPSAPRSQICYSHTSSSGIS